MAKQEQKKQGTDIDSVQSNLDHNNLDAASLLSQFESIDESRLASITNDFFKFEEETTYNLIFNGMTNWTYDGDEIEGVKLIDKSGKTYRSSLVVLRNSLRKVTELPCFVKIKTGGMKKGDNGKYLEMEILVLPRSTMKNPPLIDTEKPKNDLPFD